MNRQSLIRIYILIIVVLFIGWGAFRLFTYGKVAIDVQKFPNNTKVTIDNSSSYFGKTYVTKFSTHTVLGEAEGYKPYKETFSVEDEDIVLGVLPSPFTDGANTEYEKNSNTVEKIGGINANRLGAAFEKQNPIMTLLPYTDPQNLYTINSGVDQSRVNGGFLSIDDSSTEGRRNAVTWITSKGYDVAQLDIRYKDFVNPLIDRGRAERGYLDE